jgi:hypothetical protein
VPVVVLCLALAACTISGGGAESSPGATGPSSTGGASSPAVNARSSGVAVPAPSRADIDAAAKVLAAVHLDDENSINEIEGIRFSDAGANAAREAIESGASGAKLWAATWVYSTVGLDTAPLRRLFNHADPSIRLMSACGALSMGEAAGFKVLVDLLTIDGIVTASRPPMRVWESASDCLQFVTDVDLGPGPDASPQTVSASAAAWSNWLDRNRSGLRFDPTTGTWRLA